MYFEAVLIVVCVLQAANSSHAYRLLMRGAVEFVHLNKGHTEWDTPQLREVHHTLFDQLPMSEISVNECLNEYFG